MMEWSCLSASLFVFSSFIFATSNGDTSTGATQSIRCMMSVTTPVDCASLKEVAVPKYLVQVYYDSPSLLQDALRSRQLNRLTNEEIGMLPTSFIYLLPRGRLMELNVTQLVAILRKHADDTSLARQVVASLHTSNRLQQLLKKIKVNLPSMSQDVLHILGEAINQWDLNSTLHAVPLLQEPIWAYVHPPVLLRTDNIAFKLLSHLKAMEPQKSPIKESIRTITKIAMKNEYPLTHINWLILGLSSDEIKNDSLEIHLKMTEVSRLDFSYLQARAVFERIYRSEKLSISDFIDCLPLLTKLSPSLLQQLPLKESIYENLQKLALPQSLPTACQLREYVKAYCNMAGMLGRVEVDVWGTDEPQHWVDRIRYLGSWVFTLPMDKLEEYLDNEEPLDSATLQRIDSPALSALQAYYLTKKGASLNVTAVNSVLGLDRVLAALPASELVTRQVGEISSTVFEHLAANLPARADSDLPRTLALVHKLAHHIGEWPILSNILSNQDVNSIMNLVSPSDIRLSASRMLKLFHDKHEFASVVRQLPQPVLAALLELQMSNNMGWNWSTLLDCSHVNNLLVGGLNCLHIEEMDTGLFIPIMAEYNRHRKKAFPKNLQRCSVHKLVNHLKLKMDLSQMDPRIGLISILEPVEIESVGGFVLAALPVDTLKQSPYLGNILNVIGKLSTKELILAVNMSRLQDLAQLAITKDGNTDAFIAGNLIWFLKPNTSIPDLKLILESRLLDTTLCLPEEYRRFLALKLMNHFGPPDTWTATVLATLQDLLVVFNHEELQNVSRLAWTEAADSLVSHYADDVDWIKSMPFYQICGNFLGHTEENKFKSAITGLARWYLQAGQWLLNTVQSPTATNSFMPQDNIWPLNTNVIGVQENPRVWTFDPVQESNESDEDEEINESSDSFTTEHSSSTTTEEIIMTTEEKSSTTKITNEEIIVTTEEIKKEVTSDSLLEDVTVASSTLVKTSLKTEETVSSTLRNVPAPTTESTIGSTIINLIPTTTEEITATSSKAEETIIQTSETTSSSVTETITPTRTTETNLDYKISNNEANEIDTIANDPMENNLNSGDMSPKHSLDKQLTVQKLEDTTLVPTEFIHKLTNKTNPNKENIPENNIGEKNISGVTNRTVNANKVDEQILFGNSTNYGGTSNSVNKMNLPPMDNYNKTIDTSTNITSNVSKTVDTSTNITSIVSKTVDSNKTMNITGNIKTLETPVTEKRYNQTNITYLNQSSTVLPEFEASKESSVLISTDMVTINNSFSATSSHTNTNEENKEEVSEDDGGTHAESIIEHSYADYDSPQRRKRSSIEFENSNQLTCNALRMVGKLSALGLTTGDVSNMDETEVNECRVEFGAMELDEKLRANIWRKIRTSRMYGFHLLGNLLKSAATAELWDHELEPSKPWGLENINALIRYNNENLLLEKLLKAINNMQSYPLELLAVLGSSLCSLPPEKLSSLSVVGVTPWTNCPPCLPLLAQKAVQELGPVSTWTQHHVHVLHGIVAGLDLKEWEILIKSPHKPLSALLPAAARCLNISHIEVLSLEQLKQIPTLTLQSLQDKQTKAMSPSQLSALADATNLTITEKLTANKINILFAGIPSAASNYAVAASCFNFIILMHLLHVIINYV